MLGAFSKTVFLRRPLSGFKVWRENTFLGDKIFVFVTCLRQIGNNKIWEGHKKNLGDLPPNTPPCRYGPGSSHESGVQQEWRKLHCKFNSLVRFDWRDYVTFHLRSPLRSQLQSFLQNVQLNFEWQRYTV